MKKLLLLVCVLLSVTTFAQTYTNGCGNWTNVWRNSSGCFGFTGGVGLFSFGTTAQGDLNGRFITVDGTLNGTQTTLNPGQKIVMRIAGQDSSGRTGIVTDGIIGFSLRSTTNLFDGGGDLDSRYNNNVLTKVEFRGGDGNARFLKSSGLEYANMPNFATFKSGVTYEIEVISDKEFNLIIGGTRNNIEPFANGGGAIRQIQIRNSGANMDGLFTNLVVSNLPINLTANTSETFTVTGVISNNGANVNTVIKNGVGTVVLTGQNTYTGLTTVNSGTLRLNRTGGATLQSTNDVTVASGATLRVSTNQTLNNLTVPSGAQLSIDSGVTLTINGIFTYGGSIVGAGSMAYGGSGSLIYGLTGNQTTAIEWPSSNGPSAVTLNSGNYTLNGSKTVTGDVTLSNGTALTVPSTINLTVNDQLINNGTVTIENNANLIQAGSSNNNSGNISIERNSSSLFRLDYVLWSSPVANQNLLDFSPLTLTNRFYVYNSTDDQYDSVAPGSTDFEIGTGYLIRMPDDHPSGTATVWSGEFNGLPNNGDVSVTVANNTYNAVGNPYPSTIDADDFITTNSLTEALYFWRKTNNTNTTSYATYTLAGGVGTGSNSGDPLGLIPNGVIQVGQGFIARSTSTSLVFDNTMRLADNNNQFFRSSSEIENNRIRLTTTGSNGFFGQILVNYMTDASNEIDATLDGKYINDSEDAFYTLLTDEPYAIQARTLPFNQNDVVPLGFKTTQAGDFTVTLNQFDGLFDTYPTIFIKDNLLGIEHNIKEEPYSFVSESGVFNERFEIVYQSTLSVENPIVTPNAFLVYAENNSIQIKTVQEIISSVRVFDISGRLLTEQDNINATEASYLLNGVANQILMVQLTTKDGEVITKKIHF